MFELNELLFNFFIYREAEATRNALHGIQWPIGNGKKLIIDFGTVEAMQAARNPIVTETIKPLIEKTEEKVIFLLSDFICSALFFAVFDFCFELFLASFIFDLQYSLLYLLSLNRLPHSLRSLQFCFSKPVYVIAT